MNSSVFSSAGAEVPILILCGGFLGAGKTTAISALAHLFLQRGRRPALIVNDQAGGLVDRASAETTAGPAVAEIAGGCFCCKLSALTETLSRLECEHRPDVFLAEPVGSCTDIVATVLLPLREFFGERLRVAPFTVLADCRRVADELGHQQNQGRRGFSKNVSYIFGKQIEEAQAVALTKVDRFNDGERAEARTFIEGRFPGKRVFEISAKTGEGLGMWLEWMGIDTCPGERDARQGHSLDRSDTMPVAEREDLKSMAAVEEEVYARPTIEVDYERYAEGEALLGWVNASVFAKGEMNLDGHEADGQFQSLAAAISARIEGHGVEIAHLKLAFLAEGSGEAACIVNQVISGEAPSLSRSFEPGVRNDRGTILVNVRAEGDPAMIREAVESCVREHQVWWKLELSKIEAFRPGRPVPERRVLVIA